MRVPDEILDAVCFLAVRSKRDGRETWHYGGTAFFVAWPSEADSNSHYLYLVTARHCIQRATDSGEDLHVRVNWKDGGARNILIVGEWGYPENDADDVAVHGPVSLEANARFTYIPHESFATAAVVQVTGVGVGDDLVIVGLFTARHGKQQNLPLVRQGIIAAMPIEPFDDDPSGKAYHAYLAEVRSIGGLSGSPAWVRFDSTRMDAVESQMEPNGAALLGLVRGHWDYKQGPAKDVPWFEQEEREAVHMGVATITPVASLVEVLTSEVFVKNRRKADASLPKTPVAQTLDSRASAHWTNPTQAEIRQLQNARAAAVRPRRPR